MRGTEQITLNGVEVWAFLVEQEDGYRLNLTLDDWSRCNLYRGERIALQRGQRLAELLFLAEAVEMPPVAWFNLRKTLVRPSRGSLPAVTPYLQAS
jgi:hypothetical protein